MTEIITFFFWIWSQMWNIIVNYWFLVASILLWIIGIIINIYMNSVSD